MTKISYIIRHIFRFDTEPELRYYRHGGILNYMVRKLAGVAN